MPKEIHPLFLQMNVESLVACLHSIYQERYRTYPKNGTVEEQHKWNVDSYDYFRHVLEPYIHTYLTINYGTQLDEFWETHSFPKISKRAFVIIERRCHPYWWFLLRNLAWAGPDFSLYIFCSTENYTYIQSLLGNKKDQVHIVPIFQEPASPEEGKRIYQRVYKDPNIYKLIDAEYMVTVELDVYFIRQLKDELFHGTYYGAPWAWDPTSPGGGGLTIRNVKEMIELSEKANDAMSDVPQDCWLVSNLHHIEHVIPPFEFRSHIFIENSPSSDAPYGIHQFWTFINNFKDKDYTIFTNRIRKLVTIVDL